MAAMQLPAAMPEISQERGVLIRKLIGLVFMQFGMQIKFNGG